MIHELKCLSEYFNKIFFGIKGIENVIFEK